MAPRSGAFRHLQKRMRRRLDYGSRRMQNLPLPLSELVVGYFDKHAPFDYMTMDYATSLARDGCVDACTFLVAMVYVDRVRSADKTYFEASDPNDVYLSALVVASKFLHDGGLDEFVYNDEWAASASTSLNRVNSLELKLLDILSWNINVNDTEFAQILSEAEEWVARNALSKRGFCTYNETTVLSSGIRFAETILLPLVSIFAGLCLVYAAVVLSVLVIPRLSAIDRTAANESRLRMNSSELVVEPTFECDLFSSNVDTEGSNEMRKESDHEEDLCTAMDSGTGLISHNFSEEDLLVDLPFRIAPLIPFCSFT